MGVYYVRKSGMWAEPGWYETRRLDGVCWWLIAELPDHDRSVRVLRQWARCLVEQLRRP